MPSKKGDTPKKPKPPVQAEANAEARHTDCLHEVCCQSHSGAECAIRHTEEDWIVATREGVEHKYCVVGWSEAEKAAMMAAAQRVIVRDTDMVETLDEVPAQ